MISLNPLLAFCLGLLAFFSLPELAQAQTETNACQPGDSVVESIDSHVTRESNVSLVNIHKHRLQSDIGEIEARLRQPLSKDYLEWMRRSDQNNLRSKKNSLELIEEASKKLETPGDDLPLFNNFLDIIGWVRGQELGTAITSHVTVHSVSKKNSSNFNSLNEDLFEKRRKAAIVAIAARDLRTIIEDPQNMTTVPSVDQFIIMLESLSESSSSSAFITHDTPAIPKTKQRDIGAENEDPKTKEDKPNFLLRTTRTMPVYPDDLRGLSGTEKRALLNDLVKRGKELFYDPNFQVAMMKKTTGDFSDSALGFFNSEENPRASRFLLELSLSIENINDEATQADLSKNFPEPRSQQDTFACVGCALASDLESFPEVPKLAAGFPIATTVAAAFSKPNALIDDEIGKVLQKDLSVSSISAAERILRSQAIDPLSALDQSLTQPLPTNEHFPFPKFIPEKISQINGPRYGATGYAAFETFSRDSNKSKTPEEIRPPNFQFFKLLLDNGIAPQVTISNNARSFLEDWLRVEASQGIGHQLLIVGYDTKIDPWDGKEKKVFIVRDSFTQKNKDGTYNQPGHFYVSAASILPLITGVYKVTGVKRYSDKSAKPQDD